MRTERIRTDVLIIGGGTSGCYAALTIAEQNPELKVVIAEKANIIRSGCLAAGVNALNAYITEGRKPEDYVDYATKDANGIVRKDLLLSMSQGLNRVTAKLEELGLVILKDENGNYVVNGSFEDADFTGWTVTNIDDSTEELDIYTRETDCCDGVQSLHFYSGSSNVNFTAEQTISGLEKGSYKLTGYIQGEAAGDENAEVFFYAVINGKTYKADAELNGYVNWYAAELDNLDVANGEITIGVSVTTAPGGWGTIDNITLVKE